MHGIVNDDTHVGDMHEYKIMILLKASEVSLKCSIFFRKHEVLFDSLIQYVIVLVHFVPTKFQMYRQKSQMYQQNSEIGVFQP